jgi:hypothetical protein
MMGGGGNGERSKRGGRGGALPGVPTTLPEMEFVGAYSAVVGERALTDISVDGTDMSRDRYSTISRFFKKNKKFMYK